MKEREILISVSGKGLLSLDAGSFWGRLTLTDWLWMGLMVVAVATTLIIYGPRMDGYEILILSAFALMAMILGWCWSPLRIYSIAVAAISLTAVWQYRGDYSRVDNSFLLHYLISSQSAVMWMCALFLFSMVGYFGGLLARRPFAEKVGSSVAWGAVVMGLVGLLVRWHESYLINPDFGHIPVSNLYEVFVLFCLMTSLIYLYYEARFKTRALGGFVMLVVVAAVMFLLWYTFAKNAHEIQPLVPALKSWWMKIHVPANFVGYGAFALAAMIGVAQLLKHYAANPSRRVAVISIIFLLVVNMMILLYSAYKVEQTIVLRDFGISLLWGILITLIAATFGWVLMQPRVQTSFPSFAIMDDITYKAITLGFAFFTIATILGAMWAADAWGGYWSWDPKETWALIVWLNYAAWLHMRFSKGWRGPAMSWWLVVGLLLTTFAFLGVNIFLSGLHSYGEL